jgi:hypothetical protein
MRSPTLLLLAVAALVRGAPVLLPEPGLVGAGGGLKEMRSEARRRLQASTWFSA